jgi:hypothetical protein
MHPAKSEYPVSILFTSFAVSVEVARVIPMQIPRDA